MTAQQDDRTAASRRRCRFRFVTLGEDLLCLVDQAFALYFHLAYAAGRLHLRDADRQHAVLGASLDCLHVRAFRQDKGTSEAAVAAFDAAISFPLFLILVLAFTAQGQD